VEEEEVWLLVDEEEVELGGMVGEVLVRVVVAEEFTSENAENLLPRRVKVQGVRGGLYST
jgi:hypothetical protein